ncbi:unnamed protein product [Moneuplotes crassus]|uniref:Uncharacterized protein n=1 Tax=Euplotes crassus TaxID=5936 RepID=A0AAD2D8C0_EUPCR|nr:unnamed protein product [Moneuplotes crassus]
MESMDTATEGNKAQVISQEKSLQEETRSQDNAICENIIRKLSLIQILVDFSNSNSEGDLPEGHFYLNFDDSKYENLARNFKSQKCCDIAQFILKMSKSKNKHFVDFLRSSFPNRTNYLSVWAYSRMCLDRSNYFNLLISLSSKVIHTVEFDSLDLHHRQLKRLIAAYRHVRVLKLSTCKLEVPNVPDFSKTLTRCRIQSLWLLFTGGSYSSDYMINIDQFKNLIQGLVSSPDLRLSLRKVHIKGCVMAKDKLEKIFVEHKFRKVKVIGGK